MRRRNVILAVSVLAAFALAGCSGNDDKAQQPQPAPAETAAPATAAPETAAPETPAPDTVAPDTQETAAPETQAADVPAQNNPSIITEDEAKNIALKDAGIKESDTAGIRVLLQTDDGIQEYEVDFYVGNREYDYTIAASDGTILEKDSDIENDFNLFNPPKDNGVISTDEAIKIALGSVPGASASDVRIHLDRDNGIQVYEGSVVYSGMEYDFEIDAQTGNIIEWDAESVYDD